MFELKKIISALLLPPGIFVILLLFSSIRLFIKRNKPAFFNFSIAVFMWLVSISPVSDALLRGLEADLAIPRSPEGDVIILLGGGAYDGVSDYSGAGSPSEEMAERILTAVRLQKKLKTPVIVSGGKVFRHKRPEASIVKRFLVDLGIPSEKVITEEESRDTVGNAEQTAKICARFGYREPILVTSAFHMKRAIENFETAGMMVLPFPAGFKSWPGKIYGWEDYLPSSLSLKNTSIALREYMGLLFNKIERKVSSLKTGSKK